MFESLFRWVRKCDFFGRELNRIKPSLADDFKKKPLGGRGFSVFILVAILLERFVEAYLARNTDLVSRDSAFEEVC